MEQPFVSQTHLPGAEGEVDFADLWIDLRGTGTRLTCWAVSRSTRFANDNLKSAVARVLFGRDRLESQRWVTFLSRHRFDAFYCQPGVDVAHEKGGAEGEGGRFRRTHLVPVPNVDSLAELNSRLDAAGRRDDHRRIGHRLFTVGQDFAAEQPLLRPLPAERLETGLWRPRGSTGMPRSPSGSAVPAPP